MEEGIGIAGGVFLLLGFALLARSVRKGRDISELLEMRHPERFEALGRPRPGYFDSVQRTRFEQFILRREYRDLDDPYLIERCEDLRSFNLRFLGFLLLGFAALGLAILWADLS
jgi:hypothetical protein